jgi:apolipoprotein D and lipocalin family protein
VEITLGRAIVSKPNASPIEGKLTVKFGSAPDLSSNYWILDTDYNQYSIVYFCSQLGGETFDMAWILSKDLELDDSIKQKLDGYIGTYFERIRFRETLHDPKL